MLLILISNECKIIRIIINFELNVYHMFVSYKLITYFFQALRIALNEYFNFHSFLPLLLYFLAIELSSLFANFILTLVIIRYIPIAIDAVVVLRVVACCVPLLHSFLYSLIVIFACFFLNLSLFFMVFSSNYFSLLSVFHFVKLPSIATVLN